MFQNLKGNIQDFNDTDIYYKGTWILHTLRNFISNDPLFFEILKGICTDFKISIISNNLLINYINKKTGKDFTSFFKSYLEEKKPPVFEYYLKKKKGQFLLFYRWHTKLVEFNMNFEIIVNKKKKRLYSLNVWQEYKLDINNISSLDFDTNKFYVFIERIK